ncbi:hypothetical protein ACG873_19840 [Mesorhizobium sp. AaZ16]|uniref:hypothetical protein n=1 Tax=Mesorhizobium sp. AaZ16 TaxID=3402289 RepID=UPI00374F7AF5
MTKFRLSPLQRENADVLLEVIRNRLQELSGDNRELLFAYRRRLLVKLTHDERGTPAHRNKLKVLKLREQQGICPICSQNLPPKYAELDRLQASLGYTPENTRLVHHECHVADQAKKGYV